MSFSALYVRGILWGISGVASLKLREFGALLAVMACGFVIRFCVICWSLTDASPVMVLFAVDPYSLLGMGISCSDGVFKQLDFSTKRSAVGGHRIS
jgi:hypothetical protein